VVTRHGLSERRATGLLGVDRSAVRYRRKRKDDAADRELLRALAAERQRSLSLSFYCNPTSLLNDNIPVHQQLADFVLLPITYLDRKLIPTHISL
jgi:hypothetical protein